MGWPAVTILMVLLLALTLAGVRRAARTWRDYLIIIVLALALIRPILLYLTGDASRFLPGFIWSDGPDSKDQIVWVSIIATLSLPVIGGSLLLLLGKCVWRGALRRPGAERFRP